MRRIAAMSAVVLAVAATCILHAQESNPFAPIVKDSFGQPTSPRPSPNPLGETTRIESIDVQQRLSALADDLGKEMNSAINEEVLSVEQARQLVKELEVVFAVKRARLDLKRVAARLGKVSAEGVPGSEELQQIRRQLQEWERGVGLGAEHNQPAQFWSDSDKPQDAYDAIRRLKDRQTRLKEHTDPVAPEPIDEAPASPIPAELRPPVD